MHDPLLVPFKKIRTTRYIIISFLLVFLIIGIVKNVFVQNKIKAFVQQGKFVKEEIVEGNVVKYYAVSRETSEKSLFYIDNKIYIGKTGDIMTTKNSPFDSIPIVHQFVSFFFGGHASMNISSKEVIESVGNQDKNGVVIANNDWFYNRSEVVGLRIVGFDENDYQNVINKSMELLGSKYNYSFIFNTAKSFYCTDFISSAINEYCGKLKNYFIVTVNDLIIDKDTYLFYYHYIDANNVMHVYYLE